MALVYLSAAWLIGVYLGLAVGTPARVAPLWAGSCVGLACLWWAKPHFRWPLLGVVVVALGCWRGGLALTPPDAGHVASHTGREVSLRGSVEGVAESERAGQRFVVSAEQLLGGEGPEPTHGQVLVVAE